MNCNFTFCILNFKLNCVAILGIDFGLKHIGVAISYNNVLAEPLTQIKYKEKNELIKKLAKLVEKYQIKKIILGISESKMAKETKAFGKKLSKKTNIPVVYQDETLSSVEASQRMVEAGLRQKKRQIKIHQAAAALILQNFLDERKKTC